MVNRYRTPFFPDRNRLRPLSRSIPHQTTTARRSITKPASSQQNHSTLATEGFSRQRGMWLASALSACRTSTVRLGFLIRSRSVLSGMVCFLKTPAMRCSLRMSTNDSPDAVKNSLSVCPKVKLPRSAGLTQMPTESPPWPHCLSRQKPGSNRRVGGIKRLIA